MKFKVLFPLLSILLLGCGYALDDEIPDIPIDEQITNIRRPVRILFIGNSITKNRPLEDRRWYGDWGMAASHYSKDYVHQLMNRVWEVDSTATYLASGRGVIFEKEFQTYNLQNEFQELKDFDPTIVVFRLGDNVRDSLAISTPFEVYYEEFTNFFSGKEVKLVTVSSFYSKPFTTEKMRLVAERNDHLYVELMDMNTSDNRAFTSFTDEFIGRHPGDKGMKKIADRIWLAIQPIVEGNVQ